ncbi:MAG TPA: acyl-CoA dehydrogenase family protein [Kofleriaceae bacterium]
MSMELKDRIATLAPSLRARARETEQLRQIPAESMRELAEAGVFRALTPQRYGGTELSVSTTYSALIDVARACTATGWVASLMAIHSFLLGRFDPRVQDEVWAAGPDALAASGVAPSGSAVRVEGGVRVTGRWSYASGVDHCAWAILNTHVQDERYPDMKPASHFIVVPAADYTIEDDWHVAGLRGSGSKSIRLDDVLVPSHRVELGLAIHAGKSSGLAVNSALFQISFPALFALIFAPSAIGTALAMIDHFRDFMAKRRAAYTGVAFSTKPATWSRLAEATGCVDAARLLLERDLAALTREATSGDRPAATLTERARFDVAFIVDLCARAVDRLYAGSGGRALFESSPLQRCFRDMHAITQHAATSLDDAGERYGKFLLETP